MLLRRGSQSLPTMASRLDRRHPLAQGLVGWWKSLPDSRGNRWYDLSGYGDHGTLTNMTPATDWVPTSRGLALDFDGTDDCVPIDSAAKFVKFPFTMMGWAYVNPGNTSSISICTFTNNDNQNEFRLGRVGSSGLGVIQCVSTGSNYTWYTAGLAVGTGVWFHLAGVFYSETNRWCVLNGVSKVQDTASCAPSPITTGTIGAMKRNGSYISLWNGQLDDVRLYNRGLSFAEIKAAVEDSVTGRYEMLARKPKVYVQVPTPPAVATIGTQTGDHYATLDAWYADMPVNPANQYKARVRGGVHNGCNLGVWANSTWNGSKHPTATNNFVIEAYPGDEFRGKLLGNYPRFVGGLMCCEPYTEIRNICGGGTPAVSTFTPTPPNYIFMSGLVAGERVFEIRANDCLLDGCGSVYIGWGVQSPGATCGIHLMASATVRNCVLLGIYGGGDDYGKTTSDLYTGAFRKVVGIQISGGAYHRIYNCSLHGIGARRPFWKDAYDNTHNVLTRAYGIYATASDSVVIRNCAIGQLFGHGTNHNSQAILLESAVLASDVANNRWHESGGTDAANNFSPTSDWKSCAVVSYDDGDGNGLEDTNVIPTYDLHLRRSATLRGAGGSLSGYTGAPTLDIDGETIGTDIGIDTWMLSAARLPWPLLMGRVL